MNRRFLLCIVTALLAAAFGPLRGATFSASDPESARKLLLAAQPGDELILSAGEWRDVDLRLVGKGTEFKPITVRAERPGETVFVGASRIRMGGEYVVLSGIRMKNISGSKADWLEFRIDSKLRANHCTVEDCAFTEDAEFEGVEKENRWLGIYGEANILQSCHFEGKKNKGTTVVVWLGGDDRGHHLLRHNYFGSRPRLGKNGGETLRVGDSKSSMVNADCVVDGNLFERCDGETECISNKSCGNVYRVNTFREVQGTLTLRHGNGCTVDGNFFLGNHRSSTGGIRIIGEGHRVVNNYLEGLEGDGFRSPIILVKGIPESPANGYFQVKNSVVAFNTIVDCKHGLVLGYNDVKDATLAPTSCHIIANVIAPPAGKNAELLIDAGISSIEWRANIFGGSGGVALDGIWWKNPMLGQDKVGLWRPVAGSPLLDAGGDSSSLVKQDMDGQDRSIPSDVGADEVDLGIPSRHPLARAQVGPSWMR